MREVLVQISGDCSNCGRPISLIKIFPEQKWKKLGRSQELYCGRCEHRIEEKYVELITSFFYLKNNQLYIILDFPNKDKQRFNIGRLEGNSIIFLVNNFPPYFRSQIKIYERNKLLCNISVLNGRGTVK